MFTLLPTLSGVFTTNSKNAVIILDGIFFPHAIIRAQADIVINLSPANLENIRDQFNYLETDTIKFDNSTEMSKLFNRLIADDYSILLYTEDEEKMKHYIETDLHGFRFKAVALCTCAFQDRDIKQWYDFVLKIREEGFSIIETETFTESSINGMAELKSCLKKKKDGDKYQLDPAYLKRSNYEYII